MLFGGRGAPGEPAKPCKSCWLEVLGAFVRFLKCGSCGCGVSALQRFTAALRITSACFSAPNGASQNEPEGNALGKVHL